MLTKHIHKPWEHNQANEKVMEEKLEQYLKL